MLVVLAAMRWGFCVGVDVVFWKIFDEQLTFFRITRHALVFLFLIFTAVAWLKGKE
ncbi:hypothetical protein [Solidesulfovibrio sp. C21]|uniref:hypothetical protein n=1 Tax=Solidesulfovibrio sp. C21 TaxID=3398613 RepID=UPI0039FCACB3